MNEKLAVEILKIIEKAEAFGYYPIRDIIKTYESFTTITEDEFKDTITALQKNECLLRRDTNAYKLNPDKNCIKHYQNILDEANRKEQRDEAKKDIDYDLVKKNLDDYPKVQKRADDALYYSKSALLISGLGFLLLLIKWIFFGL